MKTNKKIALNAELRKPSKTFNGYHKYEITIQNPNGTIEKVPAYGKDLQDALSRVVHDDKVKTILPKIERIPLWFWSVLWLAIIGTTTVQVLKYYDTLGDWSGVVYMGIVVLLASITMSITNYFKLKNTEK